MFFRYVVGNLLARRTSTLVAVLSIGLVIAASVLSLAFYHGLEENMAATGRPDNLVVVEGSVLQTTKSELSKAMIPRLEVMPEVAKDADGALVSPESHLDVEITDEGRLAPLRGVDPVAFRVHDQVQLVEGRALTKGSNELIIGRKLVGSAPGLQLGGSVDVGGEAWPIVGVFSAQGSALENEIWADRSRAAIQLKRPLVLCAVVRARSVADVKPLVEAIGQLRMGEKNGTARAFPEREYYEATLGSTDAVVRAVAGIIALLVLGAIFAAANTLHASLAARLPEFAALWVVGLRRGRLARLILAEALVLCVVAAALACAVALLFTGREVTALIGGELHFSLPFGGAEAGAAAALAVAIALAGAVYPAVQVMRRDLSADLG